MVTKHFQRSEIVGVSAAESFVQTRAAKFEDRQQAALGRTGPGHEPEEVVVVEVDVAAEEAVGARVDGAVGSSADHLIVVEEPGH
jgi:hypothetical protein